MIDGRVLVTGAGGFIGRRLVTMLGAQGADVIGWTRADVELGDAAAVADAIAALHPTTIFHLASSGVAPKDQREECVERDLAMTTALIEAATPGTRFVQAGSMAEYGFAGRLAEDAECRPHTIYGRAKLACTQAAIAHGPARELDVRVARIFGAWGPGERPERLVPMLVSRLSRGASVDLSDGAQRRDFIHLDDCCDGLIRIARADTGGTATIVNLGTGEARGLREVCERIAAVLGADPALLRFNAFPRRATDEDMLEADTARLATLTGHVPPQRLTHASDAELRAMLAAYRAS